MVHCRECRYWDHGGGDAFYSTHDGDYRACMFNKFSHDILDIHLDGADMLICFSDDSYPQHELVTGANFGCVHGRPVDNIGGHLDEA